MCPESLSGVAMWVQKIQLLIKILLVVLQMRKAEIITDCNSLPCFWGTQELKPFRRLLD